MSSAILHVLLIEDEYDVSFMYKTFLEKSGRYVVEVASDGSQAVEILSDHGNRFDLILLDLMIPKTDGMSVLKQIKSDPALSDIKIFVMSNLSQDEIVRESLELGATRYLLKTKLLPADLIKLIEQTFPNESG